MSDTPNCVDLFALARLEPLSELMEEQLIELAAQTQEVALPPGRTLFKTGDADDDLVYVIEGEVQIQPAEGDPYTVTGNTPKGRHPLAAHNPRRGTATTKTPVLFVRINQELVDTMLTWSQSASSDSEEVIMSGDEIMTIDKGALKSKMQHSPNFRKLPAANIDQLLEKMEPVRFNAGEVVIRQGDDGDYFYVIEQGEALVTRMVEEDEDSDDSVEMAHLDEGSSFGEAALISDKPRNATVSMQTDGVLLRLNKADFLTLMQEPMQDWVTYEEALEKKNNGAIWVDVRARAEYQHSHLPGAINIPLNEMHRHAQILDQKVPYICYCQTGRRSSAAAFIMSQYGFESCVLKGGLPSIEGNVAMEVDAEAG